MLRQLNGSLRKWILLQRSVIVPLDKSQHVRAFSRRHFVPPKRTQARMTKEEYRQSILEKARLRRMAAEQEQAEALEKETAAAAAADQPAEDSEELKEDADSEESEEESEDAVETSMSEDSGEEAEEEEEVFTEKELFMHLLEDEEQQREPRPRRYVPFVPSEDDDEYEPDPGESYVSQVFAKMEKDSQMEKKEAMALYPEEEVIVKLVNFETIEEKPPVRLKLKKPPAKEIGKVVYLRRLKDVHSTKTKLFERTNTKHITVLDQCDLGQDVEDSLVESLQQILDEGVASEETDFVKAFFKQLRNRPDDALHHIKDVSALLPPTLTLYHLFQRVPAILLLKNRAALEIGMECAGTLYPALHLFRKAFRLGLCHVELMEDVLRLGSAFLSMQKCLSETEKMTTAAFKRMLEDVNAIVPNFPKVVESTEASIPPQTIAIVMQHPELTARRIDQCKKKVYNWQDFNLYAYADFTLSSDDVKFNHFCEMYNMTRKLQLDFAVQPPQPGQGDIPDLLYFWKQNWMFNEQYARHKLPNGILPHQFTSIYAAYKVLALEGLTWGAFLKGLSILSEQKETSVYEEIHFYERLKASRERFALSIALRNGVINSMRMMCRREQIRFELDPQTSEVPLYDVKPINREDELFA